MRSVRARFLARVATALAVAVVLVATPSAVAQGLRKDDGHCTTAGDRTVFACWNFDAGASMPERLGDHPEFLPFLRGWDFRINLPHVRFQDAGTGSGSPAALVGVLEDATPALTAGGTVQRYGHRSNSIWVLRVAAADKRLYTKQLPSRRDLTGSSTENVASLTAGWNAVGTAQLRVEKPAVAVVGEGLGGATIYVVARRDSDRTLLFTRGSIASASSTLSGAWESLNAVAAGRASLTAAFDGRVALAWRDAASNTIKVRLYTPSTSSWGTPVEIPAPAAGEPQLVWDGTTLNVFFVAANGRRLRHGHAPGPDLAFRDLVDVSATPVRADGFHVIAWNGRLHGAFVPDGAQSVLYTVTRTPPGTIAQWVAPAPIGLPSSIAPRLGALSDNLFVVGISAGRVRYARRDPNRPGPEVTGGPVTGIWVTPGLAVDGASQGTYGGDTDLLTWNGDVYLASGVVSGAAFRLRLVNLTRAAFKQLITQKWGVKLRWGELGGGPRVANKEGALTFAKGSDIPAVGDFDGDGESDLVRFTQRSEKNVGPAPVYVARAPGWEVERWHTFFSLKGEIPLVGNFDGDVKNRDDIVTFVQKQQKDAAGKVIGPAPVWVSLSDGTKFQTSRVWHRFFSLKGEIPLVGDFNGDRKDDIVTFVQKQQKDAAGKVIGPAPVWVALSTGSRFQTSRVWHRFFSLKGEIPMVGDFNGDGKDDIATFVQKTQKDAAGKVIGQAPVWVSLSTGSSFQTSRVWHTFFSLKKEVPLVGDVNFDGRADILTFLHDRVSGENARAVFAATSTGTSFSRSFTYLSDFGTKNDTPAMGSLARLSQITDRQNDADKRTPDIFLFRKTDGSVRLANSMGRVPYPSGAPWERYKWFTEKGLGVSEFPEWIYARPKHCVSNPHFFVLLGAGGSADGVVTNLSARYGSRAAHVLEEFGHTMFANCFRKTSDPMHAGIYTSAGVDTNNLWGGGPGRALDCPGGGDDSGISAEKIPAHPLSLSRDPANFYDCRRDIAEHYFLELMRKYKLFGDEFRLVIRTTTDAGRRARLTKQYNWLRDVWFGGAEFKRGPVVAAGLTQEGLLCLPGECVTSDRKVITFDDLTTGGRGGAGALVVVSSQYASQGVTFNNLSAIDYSKGAAAIPGFARSGNVAVEPCVGVEFCTAPVRATFAKPQRVVAVTVGFSFPPGQPLPVRLTAYAGATVVGTANATVPASGAPAAIRTVLEVRANTASITQLDVAVPGGFNNGLAVDDVTFEG